MLSLAFCFKRGDRRERSLIDNFFVCTIVGTFAAISSSSTEDEKSTSIPLTFSFGFTDGALGVDIFLTFFVGDGAGGVDLLLFVGGNAKYAN